MNRSRLRLGLFLGECCAEDHIGRAVGSEVYPGWGQFLGQRFLGAAGAWIRCGHKSLRETKWWLSLILWSQRKLQQFSFHFAEALGLVNEFLPVHSGCPLKLLFFFSLSPRVYNSALRALSNYPPLCKLLCQEWGSHGFCVSVFPAHFYVVLLCAEVVQSAYSLFQEELLYM